MEYGEDFLKKVTQTGTLGYPVEKVINVLDVEDSDKFIKDFNNPKSAIGKAYQKGIDLSDFIIDSKLFEMAKGGDLKAITKYEFRKSQRLRIRK